MTAYHAMIKIQALQKRVRQLTDAADTIGCQSDFIYIIELRNRLEKEIDGLCDKLCAIKFD